MQQFIDDLPVTISRKAIQNLHLRVLPDGSVQISAPRRMPMSVITGFVREKRGWIARQQEKMAARPARTAPDYSDGQLVYLWGCAYPLRLHLVSRGRSAEFTGSEILLHIHPDDRPAQREALLNECYRQQLYAQIEQRLPYWTARTGLFPSSWQIKNMKTRWGSCSTQTKKIWLNLQLAKQPPDGLDYVIAHELTHLRYPGHGADFKAFLTRVYPGWPQVRKALNEHTFI